MSETRIEENETGDYPIEDEGRHKRRNSRARRTKCLKNIRRVSQKYDTTLEIDPSHKTAHINMERRPNHAVISGRRFPQTVTEYGDKEWDWLCQRVLTLHEGAHGRWTDFDDFKRRLDTFNANMKGVAKEIWNAAEDGAIEEELRNRYAGVAVAILHFRANLFDTSRETKKSEVSVASATISAILDKLAYDSGFADALLEQSADCSFTSENDYEIYCDEIYPRVEELRNNVLSEPNAKKRNGIIFDFIDEIEEFLDKADNDGKAEAGDGESQSGMPDDASNSSGEASEDAESLDGESSPVSSKEDVETDEDLEEELSSQVEDEAQSTSDEESGDEGGDDRNPNDPDSSFDYETWTSAIDESKRIERILDDLISSQNSRRKRNQRRGRIDGSAVSRTQTGEKRYKMRRTKPESPDMSFVIILDRSSSMAGRMSTAEIATAGFALALYNLGIDVSVIDLYSGNNVTACPFNTSPSNRKEDLADGRCAGGTPLSGCLESATKVLRRQSGEKRVIIITDDAPNNPSRYKRTLQNCPYPVVGLLIGKSDSNAAQYYNRFVNTKTENLSNSVKQLARELVRSGTN